MSELKPIIEQSMTQYAGAVLQSRALVDVRDGLKPSARQIFYSMLLHKLTSKNPYKKTANAVGMAMADFYIHGDSSCEGVIMRAGQSFAMRYPLIDVKGNAGTLIESGNWAAMRYTESRLSKLSDVLFADIDKDTINEWRDSYDNTKQYPSVLPSKGFYNICNGTSGIGIGMASSVPQFNLKELNNALITLLKNPDATFDEIYCAPDFATGAILYNEAEVKASIEKGIGSACKLRSVVEFDAKERCFIVTEIPYGVYTNTICKELEEIVNGDKNPGIERFNDLTGKKPLIKIYLQKKTNPDKILHYLYKETSLQSYFGINFTMLDMGRFPKVFTWKEMLQAHINHEKEVYRREFTFDLAKINNRIHIIEGLLKCLASIEEVIQTIKASSSTVAASLALQKNFLLDEEQAKAVLDMKLSRLAHLEVEKLENERTDLQTQAARLETILSNEELFNNELIKGWRDVANKFGDERRTKVLNLTTNSDNEPTEVKRLQISITNKGNIYATEFSTLYTQKRGGVGTKVKLDAREEIIDTIIADTTDTVLVFMRDNNYYHFKASELTIDERNSIYNLVKLTSETSPVAIIALSKENEKKNILFFTRQGMVKKSAISEYNVTRNAAFKAMDLNSDDNIVDILFADNEDVGILTKGGNFLHISTNDIRPIGRIAKGIKAIKLNDGDTVISAKIIKNNAREIVSVTAQGYIKRTDIKEFTTQGKNTKGSKIQKLLDKDYMVDFLPINDASEIMIGATASSIKIRIDDVPLLTKGAQGVKSIKLKINDSVVRLR